MIKTRLVGLLSHAKKYIVYTILWQWAALLSQVLAVFSIADLLERVVYKEVTGQIITKTIVILMVVAVIRFICERMQTKSSYLACVDVKRILREKIYEKMLKLGASYREQVSSSEVVQVSTEGVEQLETYFGKISSTIILQSYCTSYIICDFVQSQYEGKCHFAYMCSAYSRFYSDSTENSKEIVK